MSAARRHRDSLAPSLFPFLAVLLCTMGALVLILMLIVAGAQASTKSAAAETKKQIEENEALLEVAQFSYEKQLSEGRIALEKKRLVLQHLETHIQELLDELEELKRTSELITGEDATEESTKVDHAAAMSELEKQLAKAKAELNQKIEKPTGDKPIFAIIPYQGNNGTHRRPIYVECTAEGVIIQPEGVRLLPNDLRPPYGPGNPLDAALRTVRAEFPPSNGAVTSTAYPLLIVRPSGIQAYVLARAAMSGWDDQFGYELIDEDLELAFPESSHGLKNKLTKAIDLARERQAALVMAMPKQYRGYDAKNVNQFAGEWGEDDSLFAGNATTGSGLSREPGAPATGDSSGRGGFGFDDAASSRQAAGEMNASLGSSGSNSNGGGQAGGMMGFAGNGSSGSTDDLDSALTRTGSDSNAATGDWTQSAMQGGTGESGSPGGSTLRQGFADMDRLGGTSEFQPGTDGGGANAAPNGNNSMDTAGLNGQGNNDASASSASGNSNSGSKSSGSSGATNSGTASGGTGGNSSSPSAQASGQTAESSAATEGAQSQSGTNPSLSFNQQLNQANSKQESARPVARARGRNWAWSQGPPTETPVVRSIRLQCLEDRWLVLPESGSSREPQTITFETSPRVRAEQLADIVAKRVESWGIALTGGHWKPVLLVDVAADAEWRFEQLQQLLEGSGMEVQRRVAK